MVSSDPRYDAVGSASLREELFETFLKANAMAEAASKDEEPLKLDVTRPAKDEQDDAREKKEKAIKERLEKVKAQRDRVEAEIGRSRVGLNREEGERAFRCVTYHPNIEFP
jgi:heat shock protein beta